MNETRQPSRVIVGHCAECQRVVVIENEGESWPLVNCDCGNVTDTLGIANRVRFERGIYGPGVREVEASVEQDHISGTMRAEWRLLGAHVHCRVFGPYSGKAGELIVRADEWDHFQAIHPRWQFREDDAERGAVDWNAYAIILGIVLVLGLIEGALRWSWS